MNYLKDLIKQDIKFQIRHGFYLVYGIVTTIYIVLLKLLSNDINEIVTPIIIFSDPSFIGFLFIGAILFFEREQRVSEVLLITPMKKSLYIISKDLSLTFLSLLIITIIVIFIHGLYINWLYLYIGVILTSSLFINLGIILSYYIRKITHYIIVGGLLVTPFSIPILSYLGLIDNPLLYILPTTASMKLISASITSNITVIDLFYSILYLTILNIVVFIVLLGVKGGSSEDI